MLQIQGPTRLRGTVVASGSKNAALPMMAAALLADGPVCLCGVPRLRDVETQAEVLRQLGLRVESSAHGLCLETVDPSPIRAEYALVSRMRASFCVLGPLLARRGRAVVSLPGGCNIGPRPVDLHLRGLAALGARLQLRQGYVHARADRLRGATVDLAGPHGPTVTGTANVLSAAVLAQGTSILLNAACEPEIADLGQMLNAMGAKISGLGTSTLRVQGVERLQGVRYAIIPDRIEIGTLLLAAAMSQGEATVCGAMPEHLAAILCALRQVGAEVEVGGDHVTVGAGARPRGAEITALPYPGIPTDLQAHWMALLSVAHGSSVVRDRVFPGRWQHVGELRRLGADLQCCGEAVMIRGVPCLAGARVRASDLRASAALVLAGLTAEGTTWIEEAEHLDRGYERLDEKLCQLGAEVRRCGPASAAQLTP